MGDNSFCYHADFVPSYNLMLQLRCCYFELALVNPQFTELDCDVRNLIHKSHRYHDRRVPVWPTIKKTLQPPSPVAPALEAILRDFRRLELPFSANDNYVYLDARPSLAAQKIWPCR